MAFDEAQLGEGVAERLCMCVDGNKGLQLRLLLVCYAFSYFFRQGSLHHEAHTGCNFVGGLRRVGECVITGVGRFKPFLWLYRVFQGAAVRVSRHSTCVPVRLNRVHLAGSLRRPGQPLQSGTFVDVFTLFTETFKDARPNATSLRGAFVLCEVLKQKEQTLQEFRAQLREQAQAGPVPGHEGS